MRHHRFFGSSSQRALDCSLALMVVVFLWPLATLIAAAIVAIDGGPVLTRRVRIGRDGRSFGQLRFRTHCLQARRPLASAPAGAAMSIVGAADQPIREPTPFGRLLERSGLDGMPTFLNVLSGQMSLVGPSPLNVFEVQRRGWRKKYYTSLRPGLIDPCVLWEGKATTDRRRLAVERLLHRADVSLYVRTLNKGLGMLLIDAE